MLKYSFRPTEKHINYIQGGFLTGSILKVVSMELVPPNGEEITDSAIKVLSMELVSPNKVHREEAKSGDGVGILG